MNTPIFVTQPFLPPLEELTPYLKRIWESKHLTNCGPLHQELEDKLSQHLGVKHISLFANATIALVTALKALRITGEVITTPFSFIATSHSLLWNGIKPVFVDVDPNTLNLDPLKIEAAITKETSAVLPVHCYGHPCDVDAIQRISDIHNLRVIYDAAHAFGVECHCGSLLNHGDLSVLSFHATKVFNTFEGGAIICPDESSKLCIDQLKNFGHNGEIDVIATGINGKMSEFNAALGLLQLKYIDDLIAKRKTIDKTYRENLKDVDGIHCLDNAGEAVSNYSYFPILVKPSYPITRDLLNQRMRDIGIVPRKYFYPLITEQVMYRDYPSATSENLKHATEASMQILCLPIYPDLALGSVLEICKFISIQSIK